MLFKKLKELSKWKKSPLKFFVHIPKTAGTSFRHGIESISKVACHYGAHSDKSSELVQQEIYIKKDYYSFLLKAKSIGCSWISGHLSIKEYMAIIDPRYIVTFVREPVQRICSLFGHLSSHQEYGKDFDYFCKEKRFINGQSKILKGFPIELIGVLGITEKYEESVRLINEVHKIKVPILKNNINTNKQYLESCIDEKLKNEILDSNQKDIALYKKSLWLHGERIKFLDKGLPWVHGTVKLLENRIITGLAWYAESNDAVELDIYANDKVIGHSIASQLYCGPLKAKFPRLGYVSYKYVKTKSQLKGTKISVVVKATGQSINYLPITI